MTTKKELTTSDVEKPFPMVYGTFAQARAMIGTTSDVYFGEFEATWPMVKLYAGLVEDANSSYWDRDFSEARWGGVVVPPGLYSALARPAPWTPGVAQPRRTLSIEVPLPGNTIINTSTDTEVFRPLLVGDRVNVYDELVDVSEEKSTRLGKGHFITTKTFYRNQNGDLLACTTNILYRYSATDKEAQ